MKEAYTKFFEHKKTYRRRSNQNKLKVTHVNPVLRGTNSSDDSFADGADDEKEE